MPEQIINITAVTAPATNIVVSPPASTAMTVIGSSIKGDTGLTGPTGATGPQGATGPTGPQGIQGDPATNLVTSVAGKQGVVVLDKADVGLSNADNTNDLSKPISTATQTALDTKASTAALDAHTSSTANPHNVTQEQVGLGATDNVQFKQITAGTTTDVLGTALTVIRNNVAVGRIDNNASGLRVQAQSGTLQLRGTGNTGLAIDASGNTVGAGTITATNLSGTNTGDQVLPTWSTISGKPAVVAEGVDAAAARTALSLGDAATKNTGTTAGTLAAGNDSRIGKIGGTVTVSGTPTAGQVPIASSGTAAAWGTPSGGGGGASVAWSGVNVGDHLPVWANGGHATFSMITTRIIPCPLVAVQAMSVDAVSIFVDTGVATSTVDLALYTYDLTTGKPGSFVQHLATIDTSTSGLKTATFAPIALAAGIHVVIGRANTANVTLWGVAGSIGVYRMTSPSGGSNQYTFPHATWTGTVPSWPSSPTWDWNAGVLSFIGAVPKLQLRRCA